MVTMVIKETRRYKDLGLKHVGEKVSVSDARAAELRAQGLAVDFVEEPVTQRVRKDQKEGK